MRKNMRAVAMSIPLLLTSTILTSPWVYAGAEKNTPETSVKVQTSTPKGSIMIRTVQESDFPSLAKVSLQQAIQVALGQTPGGLLKAETEEENGALVHQVEVVGADKSIIEFTIDAGTGAILKQSVDQSDTDKHAEHEDEEND